MKLQVYGCLFLISLGLIIGCQDNGRISNAKEACTYDHHKGIGITFCTGLQ